MAELNNLIVNGDAKFNGKVFGIKFPDTQWTTPLSPSSDLYYKLASIDLKDTFEAYSGVFFTNIANALSADAYNLGHILFTVSITKDQEPTITTQVNSIKSIDKFTLMVQVDGTVYNIWILTKAPNICCTFAKICEASYSSDEELNGTLTSLIYDNAEWIATSPDEPVYNQIADGIVRQAIEDKNGNDIPSTYVNDVTMEKGTFTISKGDGKTTSFTIKVGDIGASEANHTHNYAGSDTVGGTATSARTADSATNDGQNQNIASTYIKSITINGTTVTITKGDGSTSTATTLNTTYSVATQSKDGLMSATDKTKLDGLSSSGGFDTGPGLFSDLLQLI